MNNGFLRVATANPEIKVADTRFNAKAITDIISKAEKEGIELLVFPELCITGCTCGDLFFQQTLLEGAQKALGQIVKHTEKSSIIVFVGLMLRRRGKLCPVSAVLQGGKILGVVPKTDTADSDTVSLCGSTVPLGNVVLKINEITVGAQTGANAPLVTVVPAASCETVGKAQMRRTLAVSRSLTDACAYIYADAGRGESTTDTAFAGHSIIAECGEIIAENKPFGGNDLTVADIDTDKLLFWRSKNSAEAFEHDAGRIYVQCGLPETQSVLRRNVPRMPFVNFSDGSDDAELILSIQAEGLRKRMEHTGAKKFVLGVSGGLDSALALLVCLRTLDSLNKSRGDLIAISMPGFGTSEETAANALTLAKESKADYRIIDIKPSVTQHLKDINHDLKKLDAAYENAQARMRTVILMDIANREGGIAVGTGDLSEAALGWCTYNGDHMSMYGVNASVPKTLVKYLVKYEAERIGGKTKQALNGVLATEISPELLPTEGGKIAQKTEDIIGSFELNDFFLYHAVFEGSTPKKTLMYAAAAFGGAAADYADSLKKFYKRFFSSQFKRSCSPDGAKAGFSLSPRGDWRMPSDAVVDLWLKSCDK